MPYVASTNHLFKELTAYVVQIATLWSSEAKSLAWELGRRLRMRAVGLGWLYPQRIVLDSTYSADHGSSMAKLFGLWVFLSRVRREKNDFQVIVF